MPPNKSRNLFPATRWADTAREIGKDRHLELDARNVYDIGKRYTLEDPR